jgi:hypothetical protein
MKMRGLLQASLGLAAAVLFVLGIQAQPPRAGSKKPGEKTTSGFDRERLVAQEKVLMEKYREFEEAVLTLKQRLERSSRKEDKDRAAQLKKVLDESNKLTLRTKFENLVQYFGSQKFDGLTELDRLGKLTGDLATDLKRIIDIWNNSKTDIASRKAERIRLEKLIKELEQVIRDQRLISREIARGEAKPKDLTEDQRKNRQAANNLRQDLGQLDKDGKGKKGQDGKGGEAKDLKSGAKDGKGKGKPGESKNQGKPSEGKKGDGKTGDGKGKPGESKANPKGGQKSPDGKQGQQGEAKPGAKGGEKGGSKGAKGGESKSASGSKGSKGGDSKSGQSKAGSGQKGGDKQGQAKGSGEKKPNIREKPEGQKEGQSKPGAQKGGEKSGDSKSAKGGDSKSSQSKGGQSSPSKAGQSKGGKGGQGSPKSGGQPKDGDNDAKPDDNKPNPDAPQPDPVQNARKQIERAEQLQREVERKIEEAKKQRDGQKESDDAVRELEKAKKRLEDLLRQLREEELERLLTDLKLRCEEMKRMQIMVLAGTRAVDKAIQANPDKKARRENIQESLKWSDEEKKIVAKADQAIGMLEAEGSAVAFHEVFTQVRDDMKNVKNRLGITDVGKVTQAIEQDIIDTLEEMIKALEKAKKDLKNKKSPPPKGGQPPPNQDQKLLDQIAELKMIRAMQMRVNRRTLMYAREYEGEQANEPRIQSELLDLAGRQDRVFEVTNKIARGDNR